jgi:VWFA-related protein
MAGKALQMMLCGAVFCVIFRSAARVQAADAGPPTAAEVAIRQVDDRKFPEITLEVEVKRGDGTSLLDASRDAFRVYEFDQPVEIRQFQSPISIERRPTNVILVVDRSGSMAQEDRMGELKRAVGRFLETMPAGSRVTVIAFSTRVERLISDASDAEAVRRVVARLEPGGSTRFYDAVAAAMEEISVKEGRRAILALTDGEDTFSREHNLEDILARGALLGVPIHTLGLGTDEQANLDLGRIAGETRGRFFPTERASELTAIFEEIARGLGETYTLSYRSERPLPDGTRRPVRVEYVGRGVEGERAGVASARTEVYIPGLVVPAPGWSVLFVAIVGVLGWLWVWNGGRSLPRAG